MALATAIPSPDDAFATMRDVIAREAVLPDLVRLEEKPGRGRCLVAAANIPMGGAILRGNALTVAMDTDTMSPIQLAPLAAAVFNKLGPEVMALQGTEDTESDPVTLSHITSMLTPTAVAVGNRLRQNRFACSIAVCNHPTAGRRVVSGTNPRKQLADVIAVPDIEHGMFLTLGASMMNHSCTPNAIVVDLGVAGREQHGAHMAVTFAVTNIEAGQEICVSYGDCADMPGGFGFTCGCGRTAADARPADIDALSKVLAISTNLLGLSDVPFAVDTCLFKHNYGVFAAHMAASWKAFGGVTADPPNLTRDSPILTFIDIMHPEPKRPIVHLASRLMHLCAANSPWIKALVEEDNTDDPEYTLVCRFAAACAKLTLGALPIHLFLAMPLDPEKPSRVALGKAILSAVTGKPSFLDTPVTPTPARVGCEAFPTQDWNDTVKEAIDLVGAAMKSLCKVPKPLAMKAMAAVTDDAAAVRKHFGPHEAPAPAPQPAPAGVGETKMPDT